MSDGTTYSVTAGPRNARPLLNIQRQWKATALSNDEIVIQNTDIREPERLQDQPARLVVLSMPAEPPVKQKGPLERALQNPNMWRILQGFGTAIVAGLALSGVGLPMAMALGGAVGAIFQPIIASLEARREGRPYTVSDTVSDILVGGALGATTIGVGKLVSWVAPRAMALVNGRFSEAAAKAVSFTGSQVTNLVAWLAGSSNAPATVPVTVSPSRPDSESPAPRLVLIA